MATKRLISCDIWEDEFFTSLATFDRLLWIGLIAGVADDQGRMQDNTALLRSKIFPLDDIPIQDIENGLEKFVMAGKIIRYQCNGKRAIQILNWWKHQSPRWAAKSNFPPPEGWTDRVRCNTPGNDVVTENWEEPGGYTNGEHTTLGTTLSTSKCVNVNVNDKVNDKDKGEMPVLHSQLFDLAKALSEVTGIDLQVNQRKLMDSARDLMQNPKVNPAIIRQDYGAGGDWYKKDWRGKKSQRPSLANIKETLFNLRGGKPKEPQMTQEEIKQMARELKAEQDAMKKEEAAK